MKFGYGLLLMGAWALQVTPAVAGEGFSCFDLEHREEHTYSNEAVRSSLSVTSPQSIAGDEETSLQESTLSTFSAPRLSDADLFHYALVCNKASMAKDLLAKGLDVNKAEAGIHQNIWLHLAITGSKLPFVDLLLNAGANVNLTNADGDAPLHLAVDSNQLSVVEKLLAAGANVNAQNASGDTPLHLARRGLYVPIIRCLIQYSPNLHLKNDDDEYPFPEVWDENAPLTREATHRPATIL